MANLFGKKSKEIKQSKVLKNSENDNKKSLFSKKIIVLLAICLLGIVSTAITLGTIYYPRNISSYISEDISTLKRIEVQNYDGAIFTFDENIQKELLGKILDINVIPKHLFIQKVVSSFDILVYFEGKKYSINQFNLYDGENKFYFEPVNFSMYTLVCEYVGESI